MTAKKVKQAKPASNSPKPPKKQERRVFSAEEKCEAVLSLWSERRKPSEICRELGIQWANLNQWQDKALSAMLEALKPRTRRDAERGPALGPKLEKLLKKATQRQLKLSKLERRLEKIQESCKSA